MEAPATPVPDLGPVTPYLPRVLARHFAGSTGAAVRTIDGTLLLIDVSGFTRLSERLARRGREGAEHLADAIGLSFSALLAVAYANGGSLLKFGGDALLVLFADDGHAERACVAASKMQLVLRDVGRIDAGGARVRLRMSAGVHRGPLDLHLVGTAHRELFVGAPAATAVCRAEAAATAGEVVLSPAAAAAVPGAWLGARRGEGCVLRPVRAPDRAPPEPAAAWSAAEAAACLSPALRAHVLSGPHAPEHRWVTVGFVRITGLDAVRERGGGAAVTAALHELLRTAQRSAGAHEVCVLGSDVAPDGAKLVLVSGAPRTLDDDEERMLLTLREVVGGDHGLTVRAGVHRGPVFAGDVGPPYRRTYTVMGDAVNLAARLMAEAPPGSMYATAGVLDRSRTRFAADPLAPLAVRGRRAPVAAWSVGPALGARRDEVAERVPLVGREREVAVLEEALAEAAAGTGRVVELVGEPGIGKTRLVEELRDRAPGLRTFEIVCERYTAATPYAVWRHVLRALVGAPDAAPGADVRARLATLLEREAPELLAWMPLLAVPLGFRADPTPEADALGAAFRTARLHGAVGELLGVLLREPALIAVEDAHHMDGASAELLRAVLASVEATGSLLVLVRRAGARGPIDGVARDARRLVLAPLAAADSLTLAEALADAAPLPPHLVRLSAQRAGGNPQLLSDLLREAALGHAALPDSVEAAATARIDRLARADRELVRRASVLGVAFRAADLEPLLEGAVAPPTADTWRRLRRYFAVWDDGQVHFRRPVVREAAYAGLPFATRRRLHALAARRVLAGSDGDRADPAGVLSLHLLLAGDHAGAWRHARLAADAARRRFAYADAAYLYRRALEAARRVELPPHELADVFEALAEAHRRNGEPGRAAAALTRARRLTAADPRRQARLLHTHALVTMDAGGVTGAVRWALRGLRALEGLEDRDAAARRALLGATLATIRQRQGRMDEAIALCRRTIAEAEAADEERALARACFILDWALVESGRARAAGFSARALNIVRRRGDVHGESTILNNLGGFAYRDGRWDEAARLWRRAADASERAGDLTNAAFGAANLGELLSDVGRLDEADGELRRASRVFRATDNRYPLAYATALRGRVAARAGRHTDAAALLDEARQGFRRLRADQDVRFADALRAEAHALAGRPDEAAAVAGRLLARGDAGAHVTPLLHRVRGMALAQSGDRDGARAALERALAEARALDARYETALALDALERLGGSADAARAAERDALLERLGVRVAPAVALEPAGAAAA